MPKMHSLVHMTIRHRLVLMAGISVLVSAAVAGVGFHANHMGADINQRKFQLSSMVANQGEADMMHDALRGDALLAMQLSADQKDAAAALMVGSAVAAPGAVLQAPQPAEGQASVTEELRAHSENLAEMMDRNRKIAAELGVGSLTTALADIGPSLDAYAAAANRLVSAAFDDLAAAKAMRPEFQAAFLDLEERMEQLSDLIGTELEAVVAESHRIGSMANWLFGAVCLIGAVVIGLWSWATIRAILRPLSAMTATMSRMASGESVSEIPALERRDEIGDIGRSLKSIQESVSAALGETIAVMSAMARGDLSKRIAGDYKGQLDQLKSDANATAEKLAEIVGQTVEGMANIKTSTTEIASGATDLSSRTEEQVASLEEIAASIRQLNSTVQQSAENAGQASQLAMAARSSAESGGTVASSAVKAMGEIEQSSQKISDIVGMIDEIAFQTNLLALNAAVEAARAGEAGRGFAVVAGEVRALAQRSSQASKEIKALIMNSNLQVKQGVDLVNKAGSTLGEIVTSVKRVSDIVAEIAAANKEQSASVAEVQEAIGQIEQATQQNAALVEETTAALGSADNQVQGLTEVISFFQTDAAAVAKPANAGAPAKGAKAVQAKLAARVAPAANTPPRKLAATGTDDGWEEF